ncbi:uncharacterized protein PADG_01989 [Paracoccidioides brasiliensis Pb18]|uniref:PQ loop repeat protein n=1 Tax=Paracoccidioides brasiliensis (strain Pb18) TaxID=502780 RepID=C1G4X3_PARBD|nr:uncharacterized protein PADG_01989 [Paracoccidioides brasiliensis Pb18]EEH45839.1 hypothetical protein PADG_01989 [Paracoccidioides brasiliensis Pb18]ODH53001.1 hypothetical protein GX48_00870 [Paracoccidioides brasiliensis]
MPPAWVHNLLVGSLPDHCDPSSPLLAALSAQIHTCIPTWLSLISSTLGTLSIVSWLFAQLPQIFKNYQLQSASGLSVFFLVEWCLGDTTNLVGAILLRQAGWQITIAAYYVFVDVILVFQYYWYACFEKWRLRKCGYAETSNLGFSDGYMYNGIISTEGHSIRDLSPRPASALEPKNAASTKGVDIDSPFLNSLSRSDEKQRSSFRTIQRTGGSSSIVTPFASPRTILFISMLFAVLANAFATSQDGHDMPTSMQSQEDARKVAGRIISWSSTVLYLVSRLPQLYKNYRRQSTSGLSPLLFFAAFCGNFFYSTSLLTNPNAWSDLPPYGGGGWAGEDGNDRLEWIGCAVPFFLGAAGVLALDGAMGIQFLMYGEKTEDAAFVLEPAERGRAKWRRVSGWMRGWIPSVSPEQRTLSAETEGLLIVGQDRYGAV